MGTSSVPVTVNAREYTPTHLSDAELRLLVAVANAFFPPGGPIPQSGERAGVMAWFDAYFARSARRQLRLMRLMLRFTQLSPLLFGPRRARFTSLSQDERVAFLAATSQSRIYFRRVVFLSLRALMTMAYLADPQVMAAVGIEADTDPFALGDAPPFERIAPPAPAASGVRLKGDGTAAPPLDGVVG